MANSMINGQLDEKFKSILVDSGTPLEDVIKNSFCLPSLLSNNPLVVQYFMIHSSQLLDMALFSNDHLIGISAYRMISSSNTLILSSIVNSQAIPEIFKRVLVKADPFDLSISRLAGILECTINMFFPSQTSQLNSIDSMIHFCENPGIGNFFEKAFSCDEIVTYLLSIKFEKSLFADFQLSLNGSASNFDHLDGLCKLMKLCFSRTQFLYVFLNTPGRVQAIVSIPDDSPQYFKNSHSDLLLSLCCEASIPQILENSDWITKFLRQKRKSLLKDFVGCLDLITKILDISPQSIQNMEIDVLIETCFTVLVSFSSHTIALSSATKLLRQIFLFPDLQLEILQKFVPFAFYVFESSGNRIVTAHIYALILDMRHILKLSESSYQQLEDVYANHACRITWIISSDYGGNLETVERSVDDKDF